MGAQSHAGLQRSQSGGQDEEKRLLIKVQIIPENPFSKLSTGRSGVRMS